jgi:tetratricopeptide (TPR) repeat protein
MAPKSIEVLLYLVRNAGRPISKEELLQAVWPGSFIEESNLTQHIFRLRRAFESEPAAGQMILTMPGRGYQFTAEVSHEQLPKQLVPADSLAAFPVSSLDPDASEFALERWTERTRLVVEEISRPVPRSWLASSWRTSAAVLAVAVALLSGWGLWRGRTRQPPPETRQIVLADFVNSTGDTTFDRTLRRALEVDLGQSPYLNVMTERAAVSLLQMMGRNGDTPMTPDVAREVCERSNRKVLIEGSISAVGPQYLVVLQATSCTTAEPLSSAKAVAGERGQVLATVDKVAEQMRSGLGESAASLAGYSVPLSEATTPSLDALQAYSLGMYFDSQRRPQSQAIAAFQRAIELDPHFAMAYRMLGVQNGRLGQNDLAAAYYKKAFELSSQVSMHEQLAIRASYYAQSEHDVIAGIKASELFASTYPQDPVPEGNLVDGYMTLGQWDAALVAGERAMKLFPDEPIMYENLTTIYRSLHRYDDALKATQIVGKLRKGNPSEHLSYFTIAMYENDEATFARESAWFGQHDDGATVLYYPSFRADAAAGRGDLKRAEQLFQAEYDTAQRANLPEAANGVLINQALAEYKLGCADTARTTLRRIPSSDKDSRELAAAEAELGDPAAAERFLTHHAAMTSDTLLNYVFLPRIRAAIAIQRGKPLEAIAALESARPYEMRDYTVPSLRAEAYLKAGRPDLALQEFNNILANPGIDPVYLYYPLAQLGVAKAYASQHRSNESRRAYEKLFELWKHADPDLPVLRQAHLDYAQLPSSSKR